MKIYDEGLELLIQIAEDAIYENDYQKGRKLLEGGLFEEPGYPKLHYTLGWFYHEYQESPILAKRHYELAIYFDPDYVEAYQGLIELCNEEKNFECINHYLKQAKKSKKISPDFVFEEEGRVAEESGDLKEALRCYRLAILNSMDNHQIAELRKTMKRCRFKRLRTAAKKFGILNFRKNGN